MNCKITSRKNAIDWKEKFVSTYSLYKKEYLANISIVHPRKHWNFNEKQINTFVVVFLAMQFCIFIEW